MSLTVNDTYIIVYFYNNIILVCIIFISFIVCCWELSGMYPLACLCCSDVHCPCSNGGSHDAIMRSHATYNNLLKA